MEKNVQFKELQEIVSICMDEIISLKKENQQLKIKQEELTNFVINLASCQKEIMTNVEQFNISIETSIVNLKKFMENSEYEWNDPRRDKNKLFFPQFYTLEETIHLIVKGGKSMARFGDGEFAIMTNRKRHDFQHLDSKLAKRLKEVIMSDEEGFLIGIADNYGDLNSYNARAKAGIRQYMTEEIRKEHRQFLDLNRKYHNAYVSRPYVMYADNNTQAPRERFLNLKRIWDKRNIIFVEGSLTRLGVGNDLFDNAASIKRIEAPAVSSFDKYDVILEAALKFAEKDTLFLIAMGPSAGVLAYDLYQSGYQAIDIGHVDLEYEWYLNGSGERCEVKNKYINELSGGDNVEDICDEEYESQVVCVIESLAPNIS